MTKPNYATLQNNLEALASFNPQLAARLLAPCGDDHLRLSGSGSLEYKLHSQWHVAETPDDFIAEQRAQLSQNKAILVFGVAEGRLINEMMQNEPGKVIMAWDRDPALIRMLLTRFDFSRAIIEGRFSLHLGIDLLDLIDGQKHGSHGVSLHPFFSQVYHAEKNLLANGAPHPRALLCEGGLFVEDLGEALQEEGYSVFPIHLTRLSTEELSHIVSMAKPRLLAAINYTNGLVEFATSHNLGLVCWEIDPTTDSLERCTTCTEQSYIFTYRKCHVREFRAAGFKNVEYLPLATNPANRKPLTLSIEENGKYKAPVSFVGASMFEQARLLRRDFLTHYCAWQTGEPKQAQEEANARIEEILDHQRSDSSRYQMDTLVEEYFPDFVLHMKKTTYVPHMLLGETAASEKRFADIASLGRHGIHVWGDAAWKQIEPHGVIYRGPAGHRYELTSVYNGSLINVDVGRLYQSDIVTMRVFDVLACGGFLIAEYSDALRDLFEIGTDLVAFSTREELGDMVSYYLAHPDKALQIAATGRKTVLSKHTISQRVSHMLRAMQHPSQGL